eukprot:COSAG01_NODE_976_length_12364_cov_109.353200_18_plen_60_part_01
MGVDGGICEGMIVSPEDKRSYRMVVLDNGLVALLAHDPEIADGMSQAAEQERVDEAEEEE